MTTFNDSASVDAEEAAVVVRILNAVDSAGESYKMPAIGTVESPAGAVLVGIRHDGFVLGLPGHAAVRWALNLARFTIRQTACVDRGVRDELVEETRALLAALEGLPTRNASLLQ
jgi:hypothetical protein